MDAGQALVVMDALLETGEATWPGVGRFVLVVTERSAVHREGVHDFPRREVEFQPAPEAAAEVRRRGGTVELEGFGSFVLGAELVFHSAPGLRARLIKTPAARFVPATPIVVASPPSPARELEPPKKRPWWRRLFS